MCLHVYIILIQGVPRGTLPSKTPAEVETVGLSDYRGERVYNLRIRGFSSQLPLTPPLSGFQLSGNETRCTRCQMSVHTDCRVTTWIRNSNRTPIKVVDRSKPRHRQHKERDWKPGDTASWSICFLNKQPHHRQTDQQDPSKAIHLRQIFPQQRDDANLYHRGEA